MPQLDLKRFGVKEDPTKEFRWVRKDSSEYAKQQRGYETVKSDKSSDGSVGYKELVLMERSREAAVQEQKERETRARRQQQAAREELRERVEGLSSKHGRNLHKFVTEEEDDD